MLLKRISVSGFRCFEAFPDVPLHKLTVFIGENDAGKTAMLDALECLLTPKAVQDSDIFRRMDARAEKCLITGIFELSASDRLPPDWRAPGGQELHLTKEFGSGGAKCVLRGRTFEDARWGQFDKQTAPVQKELLEGIGLEPASNTEGRKAQFVEAANEGQIPKVDAVLDVPFSRIAEYLPRFERISSVDYRQPDSMVQRVMQGVVDACLRPENGNGEKVVIPELAPVEQKIRGALNEKAASMEDLLRRANPRVMRVEVAPLIDFSRSVAATSLLIDVGEGLRSAQSYGEGSKKRLWMGLLEWERVTQKALSSTAVIRVYDEPDVNLDYGAERQLFGNILDSVKDAESEVQVVVCTHAMTFVDRAPMGAVNLIRVDEQGRRVVEFLQGESDDDVREFVETLSRTVGLTNSALFYERAFLLVEGESEENAIPMIYRNLFGRSLVEDGVVLVNLATCSAWRGVAKVLLRNKAAVTVLLLDQDCAAQGSSANLSLDALRQLGYPEQFLTTSCFLVGSKEFEDAFQDDDICATLNQHWPRQDGREWRADDIAALRVADKFSDALIKEMRASAVPNTRSSAKKPEFATKIAHQCSEESQVPQRIRDALLEVRRRAGWQ